MTKLQAFAFGALLGWWLLFFISSVFTTPDKMWHDEAVKKGHAEYYLDDKYERHWRWK